MQITKNYSLLKPGVDDFYDVDEFNKNADIVDEELKRVEKSVGEAVEEIRGEMDTKESLIRNVAEKTSLLNADTIPISDSLASKVTKKITFANLKESLKAYFDSYYNKYIHPTYTAKSAGLYKTTVDNTGHISAVSLVQKDDLVALGLLAQERAPNRNLLLNWDFRNPVNQRGQSVYEASGQYNVDRWRCWGSNGDVRVEVLSEGIRVGGTKHVEILQHIDPELAKGLRGKQVTLSAHIESKTHVELYLWNQSLGSASIYSAYPAGAGVVSVTGIIPQDYPMPMYFVVSTVDSDFIVHSVKLELGPTSTLANDPPANYGEQLALCQRYYQRIKAGKVSPLNLGYAKAINAQTAELILRLQSMRGVPTITGYNNITLDSITTTVCAIWGLATDNSVINLRFMASELNAGEMYGTLLPIDTYIDFDAEIY